MDRSAFFLCLQCAVCHWLRFSLRRRARPRVHLRFKCVDSILGSMRRRPIGRHLLLRRGRMLVLRAMETARSMRRTTLRLRSLDQKRPAFRGLTGTCHPRLRRALGESTRRPRSPSVSGKRLARRPRRSLRARPSIRLRLHPNPAIGRSRCRAWTHPCLLEE
jgi:hypothetical protein